MNELNVSTVKTSLHKLIVKQGKTFTAGILIYFFYPLVRRVKSNVHYAMQFTNCELGLNIALLSYEMVETARVSALINFLLVNSYCYNFKYLRPILQLANFANYTDYYYYHLHFKVKNR